MTNKNFTTKNGIVSLHLDNGTHWAPCLKRNNSDSYANPDPEKFSDFDARESVKPVFF